MPYAFQVSRIARRVCIRAEGRVDLHATLEAGYRLAGDTRLGDGFHVLVDLRGSSWKPSSDEALDLATAVAQIPRHEGRIALLVGTPALEGARTFCELAEVYGLHVQPFDRTREAHRWLSIHPRRVS
ncbi:MAG TPA: hypothetical protein VKB65_03610 [Myxococcota bacterium]|nr:hypothetical protein [Myxococcota bacterium]